MSEWTLEKALNLALSMEDRSIQIYTSAQDRVLNPGSRRLLQELVVEENRHKNNILQAMRDPEKIREIGLLETEIQDLRIVDRLEDVTLSPEADYQQILVYAGKRDKETHDLYIELAKKYKGKEIGKMFAKLAQEELKHKHRIEKEYDNIIMKEM